IALKALSNDRLRTYNDLIIIGNKRLLVELKKKIRISLDLKKLNIIDAFNYFKFSYGKPQVKCGIAVMQQLHIASYLLKIKKINGIVTAPVSKIALTLAGFPFSGQTEYFAAEFGVSNYAMLAWSKRLKIILVTIHKPLKDVVQFITAQNVYEKIKILNNYLSNYENKQKPKIGILGLNPHTFEFTCGAEYEILKAIKTARKIGIDVDGPIPADTVFSFLSDKSKKTYDGFVAMYHDQGMLPVKLLAKTSGVNITLGLPFIRTSPLHGVAFDISNQDAANSNGMLNAILLCRKLTNVKGH
ncbi:MAG: 4-hydroxythreonine-4-phosphate dehydrogenase PdxA, partial [candidate division WOR-3 bacterium]|nr:4-hydroxythreonine-4-phosphate dehydrogenase PdxA [candidate division WOR-3 bacterium]